MAPRWRWVLKGWLRGGGGFLRDGSEVEVGS